jgi:sec-independent protein translocase protein TatC
MFKNMSDTNKQHDTTPSTEKEMSFVEHLEELRMHLIRSLLAVVVFAVFIFTATDFIFENILFAPTRPDFATYHFLCWLSPYLGMAESLCYNPSKIQVVTLAMGEAFSLHLKICFIGGIVLAFPYLLWELWRFIKPGLHEHERKAASNLVGVGSFLFLLGISFGYFVLAPFGINFLVNYNLPLINTQGSLVQAGSYLNYLIMFTIPVGLVFQLPIVIFYLARVGIVTDVSMRTYRRHAIVVILIIAAIITPPDVISQIFVSIPVYILYEISISIAAKQAKLKAERDALEEA